jgi:hypothetical protein
MKVKKTVEIGKPDKEGWYPVRIYSVIVCEEQVADVSRID